MRFASSHPDGLQSSALKWATTFEGMLKLTFNGNPLYFIDWFANKCISNTFMDRPTFPIGYRSIQLWACLYYAWQTDNVLHDINLISRRSLRQILQRWAGHRDQGIDTTCQFNGYGEGVC